MSDGSMLGGAALGIGAAMQVWQNQQKIDMERERNDRANQLLDYQISKAKRDQQADDEMANLSEQEGQDRSIIANQGNLNDQAKASLALSDQLDTSPDAPTPAAQMADQSIQLAKDNGNNVSDTDAAAIKRAWGVGLKPDDIRSYDYNLRRAAVYRSKGDWKTAKELEDQAHGDAAGSFISAVLNKDKGRAADLYNLFPNGHMVNDINFADDGSMLVRDPNGVRKVSQYDAIAGAMAQMKPEAAANMAMNKFRNDEQMARLVQSLQARSDVASDSNLTRLVTMLGRGGGGSGTGSKSGTGGGGGDVPGIIPRDKFYSAIGIGKDDPVGADLGNRAYGFYSQMVENNPTQAALPSQQSTMVDLARKVASGSITPAVTIDPETNEWKKVAKDPNTGAAFFISPPTNPGAVTNVPDKSGGEPRRVFSDQQIQQQEVSWLQAQAKSNPDSMTRIASLAKQPLTPREIQSGQIMGPNGRVVMQLSPADTGLLKMTMRNPNWAAQPTAATKTPPGQLDASSQDKSVYSGVNPLKFVPGLNVFTGGLLPKSADDLSGTPYSTK